MVMVQRGSDTGGSRVVNQEWMEQRVWITMIWKNAGYGCDSDSA